jgi:hypothetical protein
MITVVANKHHFELSGAWAPRSVHHFSSSRCKPNSLFRQRNVRRTTIQNGFRRQPKGAKASIFTYSSLLPRIKPEKNVVRAEGLEPSWAV